MTMKNARPFLGMMFATLLTGVAYGQTDSTTANGAEPDNSAVNKAAVNNHELTADDQSNSKSDVELAASVRKALIADKSLSTYAHNVKVIVKNGVVTVKGPVKNDDERRAVEKIAVNVAGADKVHADGVVAKR